uniref:Uncharacterized protein n=1 Tax=Odontella aurita TaxID=265563 RepID=A0A7S4JWH4_9STRA|mmetsp:Transcript_5587/g.16208  ORF Transcript_5587/g.16208 Transcript_5587/m.16208 type:complete len:228 (+) Transcript_5587:288-971(+)
MINIAGIQSLKRSVSFGVCGSTCQRSPSLEESSRCTHEERSARALENRPRRLMARCRSAPLSVRSYASSAWDETKCEVKEDIYCSVSEERSVHNVSVSSREKIFRTTSSLSDHDPKQFLLSSLSRVFTHQESLRLSDLMARDNQHRATLENSSLLGLQYLHEEIDNTTLFEISDSSIGPLSSDAVARDNHSAILGTSCLLGLQYLQEEIDDSILFEISDSSIGHNLA